MGAAVILLGAGATVLASSFGAVPAATLIGGNLPVNEGATDDRDISAHNSPTLARNPVDGANLVVANRIDTPRFSCALHVSADGGVDWEQTPIPVPPGEEPKCYAPDVAFGSDGTLYLSYVTLRGRGNVPNAAWITTSTDGGRSLSPPERALGRLAFQVRLTADPVTPGRLYLTWLQADATATLAFPETGYPIQLARSDDGGESWSDPVRVSAVARERVVASSSAVGRGGTLYVLYVDLGEDALDYGGGHEGRGGPPYPGTWQLVLARSDDGGTSWTESVIEDSLVPTGRLIVFIPPFPSMAVDRERDRVYASFQDGRLGDSDVWLWASPDGGTTWGEPTRVNDTVERDATSQYLPELAVAPNGRLDVVYYDRRADSDNVMNEVSLQSSSDGGGTFSPSLRVSDRPFDSTIGFGSERDLPDLGSRLGLIATDDRALAVWSDTRAGTPASKKQDLVRALVAFSDPARLPPLVEVGLRYGGIAVSLAGLALLASWVVGYSAPGHRRRENEDDQQEENARQGVEQRGSHEGPVAAGLEQQGDMRGGHPEGGKPDGHDVEDSEPAAPEGEQGGDQHDRARHRVVNELDDGSGGDDQAESGPSLGGEEPPQPQDEQASSQRAHPAREAVLPLRRVDPGA